jgi:hypothetical protein
VSGLLATLAVVQTLSIRGESQTFDEAFEIASGYSYLKTGDYRISLEQPPLGRMLSALPLLFLNLSVPVDLEASDVDFGREFLYQNRAPADTILFWARTTTILTTLCLGLALALWTRAEFGSLAALFALVLFSFDPSIIAYGRYAKDDMLVTLLSFLTCLAWADYLRRGKRRSLWLTGALFGLAVSTKFSASFLLLVFIILAIVHARQKSADLRQSARAILLVCALGFVVTLGVYAPETKLLLPAGQAARRADPSIRMLRDVVDARTTTGRIMRYAGNRFGIRAHPLFVGVNLVAYHNFTGHPAYLLGMTSDSGWWYYFPVVFAVKTPVATLLILALSIAAALWRRKTPAFPHLVALVPIAVYVGISMLVHINIGLRHILPVYPFLFALLGATMAQWRPRYALVACVLLMAESLAVYPNYLAFFNVAVGGAANGPRYLLDSNIDWGQDLIKMKSWMDARGVKEICHLYFGSADQTYYGIEGPGIPATRDHRAEADCFAAISVTPLYGDYVKPGEYAWLRELQPVARIGYSIYVYDLRKSAPAAQDAR